MDLSRRVELIAQDSRALAAAADGELTARIPSCPDWSMADLVRHVLQVHRSWCRIVAEGITEPAWVDAPFPEDADLVAEFLAGALCFAEVLGATDPERPCWTWGPQQNAGFVQRFQVQEAALHRWDSQLALGAPDRIETDGAADSLGQLVDVMPVTASKAAVAFTVTATDSTLDVTLRARPEAPVAGGLHGPASELLLVCWRRLPLDAVEVTGDRDAIAGAIASAALD